MTKDIAYIVELLRIINEYELVIISACLIYYIIISISLYFIYLRIGKKKINALIPLFNIITLLDLVSLPRLLIILVFVPYINFIGIFIVSIIINYRLGKALSLGKLNRIGLIFLPIIFMPLIATKHLEYTKLPPSRMLKEEEEIEEEEEFVLDVKYNIKDVDVGMAYDVSQFLNEGMYKEVKKDNKKDDVANEVADLTFDYNDLYNSDGKVKEEEKKEDNEDMNNQDINSQIPAMPGTIDTNNLYNNQVGVQGVNVQPTQTYSTYNQQVMPTNGATGQVQQYSVVQPMPVQNQPIPGAVAQVQTIPVNPGVSTPNGPTVAEVAQPVTQSAVEPYYPSQDLTSYTKDYNTIYNIQPQTYEEIKPVMAPIEPNQFNPTADGITTVNGNAEQSINTLQMAAPPSFEQNITEQINSEPEIVPTMPVMAPVENLVSVNIVEPEALPVITPVKNSMDEPLGSNDLMNSSFGDNNFDILKPNDNGNNYMNGGVMQSNMGSIFLNDNESFNSNQQFNNNMNDSFNPNQQFNNNMNDSFNPNQQFNNNMNNSFNSNQQFNNNMNESFNSNQQFNYSNNMNEQSNMPSSSRFLQAEQKEELPRRDYNIPQSTLDPIVMSDPMSIFGSSSGLRPTSNESLREPQMTPSGNDVCPNCGFLVKPGQPSCVVCGYRFQ